MEYYKNLELENIVYFDDDGISQIEQWKDIPDYEGLYKVSDLARVKSLCYRNREGEGILKQAETSQNYLQVSLHKNGVGNSRKVHILVAMAFLSHISGDYSKVVEHKFQNRKDNRLSMIKIITQRENTTQKHLESSSSFIGVYFHNTHKKWNSAIRIEDTKFHLGSFKTEEEASTAYNKALADWIDLNIKPKPKKFGSIYKGVTYFKARDKWVAKIKINGKLTHIGIFKTELEAHYAFEEALLKNPGSSA